MSLPARKLPPVPLTARAGKWQRSPHEEVLGGTTVTGVIDSWQDDRHPHSIEEASHLSHFVLVLYKVVAIFPKENKPLLSKAGRGFLSSPSWNDLLASNIIAQRSFRNTGLMSYFPLRQPGACE